MSDAWTKELGERTVPNSCRIPMNQMLAAYKEYVRVEGNILLFVESMDTPDEIKNLQPRLNEALDQEDAALKALHNVKIGNACDGY